MCTSTRHTSSVPVMYNKWGFLSTSVTLCCLNESSYKESTMLLNMEPKCRERSSKPLNLFIYLFCAVLLAQSNFDEVVSSRITQLHKTCCICSYSNSGCQMQQVYTVQHGCKHRAVTRKDANEQSSICSNGPRIYCQHDDVLIHVCTLYMDLSVLAQYSLCLLLLVVLVMLCDCKHQTYKISCVIIDLIGLMLPNCLSAMKSFVY